MTDLDTDVGYYWEYKVALQQNSGWSCKEVSKIYHQTFNVRNNVSFGYSEFCILKNERLVKPVLEGGLGGCFDIMFLGLAHEKESISTGSWASNITGISSNDCPRWGGVCMATMNPGTETMFLSVIHSQDAVNKLWTRVRDITDAAVELRPVAQDTQAASVV